MSEDRKNSAADSASVNQTESAVDIEGLLRENNRLRYYRLLASFCGMLLILGTVVVFVWNIISFVRSYDTAALVSCLRQDARQIAEDGEFRDLLRSTEQMLIPRFKDEIVKAVRKEMPAYKQEFYQSVQNLRKYAEVNGKQKLVNSLADSLKKFEADMIKKYDSINPASPEQIEATLSFAQDHFIEVFTTKFNTRMELVNNELGKLSLTLENVANDKEYAKLDKQSIEQVEDKLLGALLELCIYQFDPKKGVCRPCPELE